MPVLIVGATRDARIRASRARLAAAAARALAIDAAALPFVRPTPDLLAGSRPAAILVDDLERAFPGAQAGGIRLVLTQSSYLAQKWIDILQAGELFVATADRAALERGAPEALQGRGPWRQFELVDLEKTSAPESGVTEPLRADQAAVPGIVALLARAYDLESTDARVQLCRDATLAAPGSAVAALALASACREQQDLAGAREALDEALRLAPEWEAAHYEDGKFWLACDDLARARDAFQRACDRMPAFSAAFSNLGATLGELDQPEAALAAFTQALEHDPRAFTVLNNIGVVSRELGRLEASEAALRRVVEIAPPFVFGHYNLGHTLFLRGRYEDAIAAYEEGQRRDPEKNRRQGCRLAMARFAAGDRAGAARDLWRFAGEAPVGEREDLLLEAYEVVAALVAERPDLDPGRDLLEHIGREIAS